MLSLKEHKLQVDNIVCSSLPVIVEATANEFLHFTPETS